MMYKSLEDFAADWRQETAGTTRIMEALTDASLSQQVTDEHRTLGRLAWHIVQTHHEMLARTGLHFEGVGEEEPVPASAAAIAEAYKRSAKATLDAVLSSWTDASLLEQHDMYGEPWPNGVTLDVLIKHEIHHRAQMTVLMRQAGLKVPGMYGPPKEQWAEFGAPAPAI